MGCAGARPAFADAHKRPSRAWRNRSTARATSTRTGQTGASGSSPGRRTEQPAGSATGPRRRSRGWRRGSPGPSGRRHERLAGLAGRGHRPASDTVRSGGRRGRWPRQAGCPPGARPPRSAPSSCDGGSIGSGGSVQTGRLGRHPAGGDRTRPGHRSGGTRRRRPGRRWDHRAGVRHDAADRQSPDKRLSKPLRLARDAGKDGADRRIGVVAGPADGACG